MARRLTVFLLACLVGVAAVLPVLGVVDRSTLRAPEPSRIVEHRIESKRVRMESTIEGASMYTTEDVYIVVGELADGRRWEIRDRDLYEQTDKGITVAIRRARFSGTIEEISSERVDWGADDAGFLFVWFACAVVLAAAIAAIARRFQQARRPPPPDRPAPSWWELPLPQLIAGLVIGAGAATFVFVAFEAPGWL